MVTKLTGRGRRIRIRSLGSLAVCLVVLLGFAGGVGYAAGTSVSGELVCYQPPTTDQPPAADQPPTAGVTTVLNIGAYILGGWPDCGRPTARH